MGNAGTKATRISSRHKAADSVSKLGNTSSVEFESRVDAELQKKMAEIRSVGNQEGKPGEKGGNHLGAQGGDESTVPELPDGPGLHDLFKMIESRTHVFAQDADVGRFVVICTFIIRFVLNCVIILVYHANRLTYHRAENKSSTKQAGERRNEEESNRKQRIEEID
jgi:hypothetical protein